MVCNSAGGGPLFLYHPMKSPYSDLCKYLPFDISQILLFHLFSVGSDFPGGSGSKSICLQCGRPGFDPWVRKMPWRRKLQPTPVFLPGKSHGQRNLVGYSPWGHKESDTTE